MLRRCLFSVLTAVVLVAGSASAAGAQSSARYRVTITNLTKGQTFTPILIATHAPSIRVFAPGTPASPQLAVLAEEGATDMLAALLRGMTTAVGEVVTGPPPLAGLQTPATTRSYDIGGGGAFSVLSLAAMLIPTNDGFVGGSNVALPAGFDPVVVDLLAYDIGSVQPGGAIGNDGGSEGRHLTRTFERQPQDAIWYTRWLVASLR